MKRLFIIVLLLTLIITSAFCQNGIIRELTGDVELKPAGATAFVRAAAGNAVAPNTIISTGFKSTAVIAVGNSLITVRPLTRLTLAEIQSTENTEKINVNLQSGRMRVDVNPPAGTKTNLTVQSPSATASVRGTSFDIDVDTLRVANGVVVYSGLNGAGVIVTAGSESKITTDGLPENPSQAAASSLKPAPPVGTPSPETITQAAGRVEGFSTLEFDYYSGGLE